jgi:excisionase family DNA binding protein
MARGTPGTAPTSKEPARKSGTARQASRAAYEQRQRAELADPRPLMGVDDTARYLDVSRWTVYRLVNDGGLKTVTVGKTMKFRPADIDAYLDRDVAAS